MCAFLWPLGEKGDSCPPIEKILKFLIAARVHDFGAISIGDLAPIIFGKEGCSVYFVCDDISDAYYSD
jgi:hypothetical protein